MTGSILSQVSSDGQLKHHYKYVCRKHRHHHCCQQSDDSANSGRSAIFSTVDICQELSSRSNDSTHEFIRIGHKNGVTNGDSSHKKKNKNKKEKRRKYSLVYINSHIIPNFNRFNQCLYFSFLSHNFQFWSIYWKSFFSFQLKLWSLRTIHFRSLGLNVFPEYLKICTRG